MGREDGSGNTTETVTCFLVVNFSFHVFPKLLHDSVPLRGAARPPPDTMRRGAAQTQRKKMSAVPSLAPRPAPDEPFALGHLVSSTFICFLQTPVHRSNVSINSTHPAWPASFAMSSGAMVPARSHGCRKSMPHSCSTRRQDAWPLKAAHHTGAVSPQAGGLPPLPPPLSSSPPPSTARVPKLAPRKCSSRSTSWYPKHAAKSAAVSPRAVVRSGCGSVVVRRRAPWK